MAKKFLSSEENSLNKMFQGLGSIIGEKYIENLVDGVVTRNNFLIFSLTRGEWKGQKNTIGFGILGQVFVTEEVREIFNKNESKTKTENQNSITSLNNDSENITEDEGIDENSLNLISEIQNHWVALTPKNNDLIIFIPCDSQNTEILFKKKDSKVILENISGQDSLDYSIKSCSKTDNGYLIIAINPFTEKEITFSLSNINENSKTASWSWNDEDWAGNNNIIMVSSAGLSNFKTENEPPCLD
jgi:hypothetical protein